MKPASIWILSPSIHEMSYYHDDITMLRAKFNQSSTQDRGRPPTRRLFLGDEGVPEAGTRGFRYLMLAHRSGVESGIAQLRSEEHTSELQSLMRHSYADFCLKKKNCTYT